jgi:hypothetical protein
MSYWLGGRRRGQKGAGMKCRYKWDSTDWATGAKTILCVHQIQPVIAAGRFEGHTAADGRKMCAMFEMFSRFSTDFDRCSRIFTDRIPSNSSNPIMETTINGLSHGQKRDCTLDPEIPLV